MPSDSPATGDSVQKSATSRPRAAARPRAGIQRKTRAEREEYARKEAERAALREPADPAAAASASRTSATRGRGGVRGGRAGAVVNKTERISSTATSGVFGTGTGQRLERGRPNVDFGYSEALDGGDASAAQSAAGLATVVDIDAAGAARSGRVGEASGSVAGRGRALKGQELFDDGIQPDEDAEDQPRRDIERIWISSDEDEDTIVHRKGKQRRARTKSPKAFGGGLRPVRAARVSVAAPDGDATRLKPHSQPTQDEAIEDAEPDGAQPAAPLQTSKKDPPSSPETTKKLLKKVDSRTKDPRVLTETAEEKAERLRLDEDIESMRNAFLNKSDTDDTIDSKEEEAVFGRTDHDRMFLFQLPPLVPQLRPSSGQDEHADDMDVDHVQVKIEDAAAATNAVPTTTVETSQKTDGQSAASKHPAKLVYTADTDQDQRLPQGLVGKLRIHKSGKVSLDWGGTDMEVRYGTEVDFLQDVICVEDSSSVKAESEELAPPGLGKAYAMGQISRKMVLIPDWSRLYA